MAKRPMPTFDPSDEWFRRPDVWSGLVLGAWALSNAVLLWLYYAGLAPKPLIGDEFDYNRRAIALLAGQPVAETFIWPPGQTWFIAAIYRVFGAHVLAVQIVQIGLLLACAVLLARLWRPLVGARAAFAGATVFLLNLHDLPPGVHAIHIHSVGKCDPPSFDSAGPHYNPTNAQHGFHNPKGPHTGDLPNITIPASGKLETQVVVAGMRQWEGEGGILDGDSSSLIIHASPDDYKTDPSGNSGATCWHG